MGLTPSPTAPTAPIASGAARRFESDDGLLTVEVPVGAVAEPAALTAIARGPDDLPPELDGLEVRNAFYELAPGGIQFSAPLTITRRISFEDLELDPAEGAPVLVLAIRSADGEWEWVADQTLERATEFVSVTGTTTRSGTIFAFGGRAFTDVQVTGGDTVQVGNAIRMTATLRFPDDAFDPPFLGSFVPVLDAAFVQLGDAEGPDNQNLGQSFACGGAGTTTVGILYSVLNLGAESELFDQLGLAPAATQVEATTPLTCVDPAASPPN